MRIVMLKTSLEINKSTEGEHIETKIERIVNNGEPITDGAPIIYTDRDEGVLGGYDIRTDRFEVAIEAMDKVSKTQIAKRDQRAEERKKALEELSKANKGDTGGESTQGQATN